jgi:hypothetical protein
MAPVTFMDLGLDVHLQIFPYVIPEEIFGRCQKTELQKMDVSIGRWAAEYTTQLDESAFSANPRLPLLLINKEINSELTHLALPTKITLD